MKRAIIATLAAAAAFGTPGAAAKEGFHIARPTLVSYNNRGIVVLALEPKPSEDGFRCELVRVDGTETRRHRMLEVAMAHAPHLPIMSIWLEDVAGSDTCRATSIVRIYRPPVDGLIGTTPEPLERLMRHGLTPPENGD